MTTALRCLALLVLLTFPALATAQIADSVEAFATAADAFIGETLDAVGVVPGLAMAVVKNDEVVYLRGFGQADREADVESTPETLFYIASSTKSFTALAAALLDARGDLNLDASLAHYLPMVEFDPTVKADSVTLRHLVTHTAGLSNNGIVFRTAFSGEHTPEVETRFAAMTEPFPGIVAQQRLRIASGIARRAERQWTLSEPLETYTGTYVSPRYGTLTITIEEGVLAARIGNMHAVATPYTAPNTIRVELVPFRGEVIGFVLDDGKAIRARYDHTMFERQE